MRIPLFIYDTSGMSLKNTFYATEEDLAPTILERVGLPIPDFFTGFSMYSRERDSSFHQSEHRQSPCYAAIRKVNQTLYKYLIFHDQKRADEGLFELTKDSEELMDLRSLAPPNMTKILREDIDKYSHAQ